MENIEYVQKGFRILLPPLAAFVARGLSTAYKDAWWDEVLDTLSDQKDLPLYGDYATLVNSLDIANCIRLIDRKWNDNFKYYFSSISSRTYAKELMGVRNAVAHNGKQDLDQPVAERALDTIALLCVEIDPEATKEIRELYKEVRAKAPEGKTQAYDGPAQPSSSVFSGSSGSESLLKRSGTDGVEKTLLTRKITINGQTQTYPVYRIRLNLLYYNDQNDRIATWISRYEAENGEDSLKALDRDIYNRIIEGFIYESNPESINKTQNNIATVGQRLPGVILDDGRVIDGNRRFTCLRRIQRTTNEPVYFETAILEANIAKDQKQIKLLELAIQHGEEEKVDYDQIDYAVGTYRDIEQTQLISISEYAATTNESEAEIKKRIKAAEYMNDFLKFIKLSGQYYVVREYQIYGLFVDLIDVLKKMNQDKQEEVKQIVFANILMHAMQDSRKFIRDIKKILNSKESEHYCRQQNGLVQEVVQLYGSVHIKNKTDADSFAEDHKEITTEMRNAMQNSLLAMRSETVKAKPEENVSKAMNLVTEIDQRQFSRMTPESRKKLRDDMKQLSAMVSIMINKLNEFEGQ